MNQINLLATDKFKIVSKALPQEFQFQTVTKLYQPFIGSSAVALYMSFVSELQNGNLNTLPEWNHEQFLIRLGINMQEFLAAKAKLEAVKLIRTKIDSKKHIFLYELIPAKSGDAFFEDSVLSGLLMEYVGEQQFAQLLNFFEGNHWNDNQFQDISQNFLNVFHSKNGEKGVQNISTEPITSFKMQLDVQLLKELLSKTFVNQQSVSQNLELINTVAVMYGLDEVQIVRLLEEAVDVNRQDKINWNHFQAIASQQYQFAMKTQSDSDKTSQNTQIDPQPQTKPQTSSEDAALIEACNQYAPMEFLMALKDEQGQTVTREEQITIQRAVEAQRLAPAVINVLIHYMLVNENMDSLNQKYFERTANNWLKNKVDSPEKAIQYVRKWQKQRKKLRSNSSQGGRYSRKQFTEKLPQWAQNNSNKENTSSQQGVNQDISRLMQRINQKTPKGDDH